MSNNYRSIAKANLLFGSVQIYNILTSLIRSKVVAILLGPEGMGIMGLLNSSIDLVKSITNMGLQTSAVRELAVVGLGDSNKAKEVVSVISKLVWITGFLGTLITFAFSAQLSWFAFDNDEYSLHFKFLSVVLILAQLTVKYNVILQGFRLLKQLAAANIYGSTLGLFIVLPLYYFWGYDAIVPGIIATAFISYIVARYCTRDIHFERVPLTFKDALIKGKAMITMGILLSMSGFLDAFNGYLLKLAITHWGSVAEVGLYNAGYVMVVGYVGLVFSSIGTDYFPRLSAVSNNKNEYNTVINQQFELMILVVTPLVLLFIAFAPILLFLLYSSKFVVISSMISWICAAMVFRSLNWCLGFMFIARNDTKLYMILTTLTVFIQLPVYAFSYYMAGLTGLGISFCVFNAVCAFITVIITGKVYDCRYSKDSYKLFAFSIIIVSLFLAISYIEHWYKYIIFVSLLIPYYYKVFWELDKRLNLVQFVKSKFKK